MKLSYICALTRIWSRERLGRPTGFSLAYKVFVRACVSSTIGYVRLLIPQASLQNKRLWPDRGEMVAPSIPSIRGLYGIGKPHPALCRAYELHFSFAFCSSSATTPSISCSVIHARTLSMTSSRLSPPSITSSKCLESMPLR